MSTVHEKKDNVIVVADEHQYWLVRVVTKGDGYGANNHLVHDEVEPFVEFYAAKEASRNFSECGQFVARYPISALLDVKGDLNLDRGQSSSWTVHDKAMSQVRSWLQDYPEKGYLVATMKTSTTAFEDVGRNAEVKRLLLDAAERVAVDGVREFHIFFDTNGNVVGEIMHKYELPVEPIEVASGANGRVRLMLDLNHAAFNTEAGPNAQIAACLMQAAEKIGAAAETENAFLLTDAKMDALGSITMNRPPPAPEMDAAKHNEGVQP